MPSTSTKYAVLRRLEKDEAPTEGATVWVENGTVTEAGNDRAIRSVAERDETEGVYVAVPARSWVPQKATLERTPRANVAALDAKK
jgi:hypothetical protein